MDGEDRDAARCPWAGLDLWRQCWFRTCSGTIRETSPWQSKEMVSWEKEKVNQLDYLDGILENAIVPKRVRRFGAGVGNEGDVLKRRMTCSLEGFR